MAGVGGEREKIREEGRGLKRSGKSGQGGGGNERKLKKGGEKGRGRVCGRATGEACQGLKLLKVCLGEAERERESVTQRK